MSETIRQRMKLQCKKRYCIDDLRHLLFPAAMKRELKLTEGEYVAWNPVNEKQLLLKIETNLKKQSKITNKGNGAIHTRIPVLIIKKSFITPEQHVEWKKQSKTKLLLKLKKEKGNNKTTKIIDDNCGLRITIPAVIRKELNLKPGLYFNWEKVTNDIFMLNITKNPIQKQTRIWIRCIDPYREQLAVVIPLLHWSNYHLYKGMYVDLEAYPERREILFSPVY